MAGLGFLAAFFPDAIAPASDVLFLFSQKQQKQKKTRALTSQMFFGGFLVNSETRHRGSEQPSLGIAGELKR